MDTTPPRALFAHSAKSRRQAGVSRTAAVKAAAKSAGSRSWADRRCRSERVDRCIEYSFADFPAPVVDNYVPDGLADTLRMAVTKRLFPSEGVEQVLTSQEASKLRVQYACGDIPEAILQITTEDMKAEFQQKNQS